MDTHQAADVSSQEEAQQLFAPTEFQLCPYFDTRKDLSVFSPIFIQFSCMRHQ